MSKTESMIVTENIMEIRYHASGRFLDIRGLIADYIRSNDIFPHWQIDSNIVQFRDEPTNVNKIGGFVGYKSAGLYTYDPGTRNFFEDKASKFWKVLQKNQFYNLPEIQRAGCRTKSFINCEKSFEEINKKLYGQFFSDSFRQLIGENQKDLQIVIDKMVQKWNMRITCGPIHKEEADQYFAFKSEHFKDTGIYIDIDVSQKKSLSHSAVPNFVKESMKLTWEKIDSISKSIGL